MKEEQKWNGLRDQLHPQQYLENMIWLVDYQLIGEQVMQLEREIHHLRENTFMSFKTVPMNFHVDRTAITQTSLG